MANDAVALLLIGGLGTRYGALPPKQFQFFDGMPLFLHATKALEKRIGKIVFVCHPSYMEMAKEQLVMASLLRDADSIIEGGKTRQESVKNGLVFLSREISPETIVIINDGNRPNITEKMIDRVIEKAQINGAAVVAYRSTDSILMSKDGKMAVSYLNRDEVYIVQTPQAFSFKTIFEAINKATKIYSDDASMVLDVLGIHPLIEEGSISNIKITTR